MKRSKKIEHLNGWIISFEIWESLELATLFANAASEGSVDKESTVPH
jgi:hypothetical protein